MRSVFTIKPVVVGLGVRLNGWRINRLDKGTVQNRASVQTGPTAHLFVWLVMARLMASAGLV
jgi:hypothetical protein